MSERLLDTTWVIATAKQMGFDLCGVVPAELLADATNTAEHITLQDWLARGFAGEMRYLHDPRRSDLAAVVPEARSVVVCALNYDRPVPYSTEAAAAGHQERGWISRYAWSEDYHDVVGEKLQLLLAALRSQYGDSFAARWYVDTGPISERAAAKVAGLGWVGKNTCLINEEVGSWLFLGVIITSLAIRADEAEGIHDEKPRVLRPQERAGGPELQSAPDTPRLNAAMNVAPDLCGNCRLCLDACPTGALVEPYVMDARRCISYLTIELRGTVPEEFRADMGWQVFGCDICQDVCPWNRASSTTSSTTAATPTLNASVARENASESEKDAFAPRAGLVAPELSWLLGLSEADYREHFRGSPVKRAKWRGLIRNACIAAGNALRKERVQQGTRKSALDNDPNSAVGDRPLVALLAKLALSEDAVIAEHARWALAQAGSAVVRSEAVRDAVVRSTSVVRGAGED